MEVQDMQGNSQQQFNDELEELIDACADYRESEQPDSGQGSWGRAMMYNRVLVHVRRVSKLVNAGAAGCLCEDGGTMIRLKGSPTTCLSCGGAISG